MARDIVSQCFQAWPETLGTQAETKELLIARADQECLRTSSNTGTATWMPSTFATKIRSSPAREQHAISPNSA
jgi:hypothetical protein